ncbi:MAG TPA: M20/M25/M40 family metallo-hydrolase [Crocinitomix sp.]|nr:M20/M25/M40 family metallo-hydrolase [Crocinitomix sp.]
MELLKKLIKIKGVSGDEANIKQFLLDYINKEKNNWLVQPKVFHGKGFQDAIVLVFGEQPTTAIFAHIDTIGFTVGYQNNLIKIGGPRTIDGTLLVGDDSQGSIEAELMLIEEENGNTHIQAIFEREIERGTNLSFKPNFREDDTFIQSPYLDNRLGVWNALQVAKTLKSGAIVFSTYEEHGGGSVGFLGRFLWDNYKLHQALISDITWVTDSVLFDKGVAISMRDKGVPRRSYLNRILKIAEQSGVKYQLEVESAGGSDGTMLQQTDLPFDWCFIGAPEDNVHSPDEKVNKNDLKAMTDLYKVLMQQL